MSAAYYYVTDSVDPNMHGLFKKLSGVVKKVFKPVRVVNKKLQSTFIPKKVRRFLSRVKRNPIFKVASAVAVSVVGSIVLGPVVGAILSKVGMVGQAAIGAGKAAQLGSAINKASKIYKVGKNLKGAVDAYKGLKKLKKLNAAQKKQLAAAEAAIRAEGVDPDSLPAKIPDYAPVPTDINSPAFFDLVRGMALEDAAPELKKLKPAQQKAAIKEIEENIRDLIADANDEMAQVRAGEIPMPQIISTPTVPVEYADTPDGPGIVEQPSPALGLDETAQEILAEEMKKESEAPKIPVGLILAAGAFLLS